MLQKMRDNKRTQTSESSQPRMQSYTKQIPINSAKVKESVAYAQIAKQNENIKTARIQENHFMQKILQKLTAINSHFTAQDERLEFMGKLLKQQDKKIGALEN